MADYETIRIRNDATEMEFISAVRIARRECAAGYEAVVTDHDCRIFWCSDRCWAAMTDAQRSRVCDWYGRRAEVA